jgi:hypothetical protein
LVVYIGFLVECFVVSLERRLYFEALEIVILGQVKFEALVYHAPHVYVCPVSRCSGPLQLVW